MNTPPYKITPTSLMCPNCKSTLVFEYQNTDPASPRFVCYPCEVATLTKERDAYRELLKTQLPTKSRFEQWLDSLPEDPDLDGFRLYEGISFAVTRSDYKTFFEAGYALGVQEAS